MSKLMSDAMIKQAEFPNMAKKEGLYAYCLEVTSPCKNRITVSGKERINFISNNYLGFSTHPKVVEAAIGALKKYGVGTGGSPLMCGTTDMHLRLIEKIAGVYQQESAILFASGYQALVGSIQAAVGKGDVSAVDSLVHRSIVDGVTLSLSDKRMWLHNDVEDLDSLLERLSKKYARKLIIVDSVYSMDGDLAPLPDLYRLKEKHGAMVLIDEAHSLGVIGKHGYGLPDHFNMFHAPDIVSGTFSKFAGAVGGFAAAQKDFIDYLRHSASAYIFSASLPTVICAAVLQSFELLEEEPEWVNKLQNNIEYFTSNLRSLGFDLGTTKTAVVPIIIRDVNKTQLLNKMVFDQGIYASPVVFPAVPPAESRLRLGVMALHTREDLDRSLEVFKKVGRELEIIK